MNRKVVSVIVLCLMIFSTLPLSLHIAGGDEKSAKAPKSPGGEVSNVRIVYDSIYKTKNYTCWVDSWGSAWNGTGYNDLDTVKNAGVIRRNTTFNITATGISSANTVRVKGPCDVGEPRPNITTWNPQYDSSGPYWNFTVPSNAPVGDYQVYLNDSYCTVYVIFDVFLTKTPSGMTENEFSGWAYNESNDAAIYTIGQYDTAKLLMYGWPFEERQTELACSVMGKDTTTPFIAATKLYRVINARVTWTGGTGSTTNLTWLLNANTGLTLSEAKKVAQQTGHTLPKDMVVEDAQCTHFCCMMSTWPRSMGIPARSISDTSTTDLYGDYWDWHNWAELYIENPDMTLSSTDDKWLVFDASDQSTNTSRNSGQQSAIDTAHNQMFAIERLDRYASEDIYYYVWDGAGYAIANYVGTVTTSRYSFGISDLPTVTPGNVTVNWLGAGDRDFFRIDVSGYSQVSLGFIEGAAYAQIYVNNTTTGTNVPGFSPAGADLKTAYYSDLVWGDNKILDINVGASVDYFYVMVDNAKEFKYANDYAKDGADAGKSHAMAELHRWVIGVEPLPPNVTVKSPNCNEVLIAGKTYNITWNATIINSSRLATNCINISYSVDGGSWTPIAVGEQNDGFFIWTVPDINSDNVKINITCNTTDNKEGYDVSDDSFTIRSSTPFGELTSGIGNSTGDRYGWNVSYAGDINGDGFDDVVVGAPYVTYNSVSECGAVYIFFGYSGIALGNLTATYANVSIYGAASGGHFGWSVSDAGKVDETSGGYDDIIIGEPDNDTGVAYIFFGRATADWSSSYTTANANCTLTGEGSNDKFGFSVSGAGDVNNDNYDDVIIGAYANGTDKGKAYIYYGRSNWADIYVHPDADADEILTEGTSAGGSYADTQVDDGVTRNITEALASALTKYDYSSDAGTTKKAWTASASTWSFSETTYLPPDAETELADYTLIAAEDTSFATIDTKYTQNYRFNITISEPRADVTQIYIYAKCWIETYVAPGSAMYAWNWTGSKWYKLDSYASTGDKIFTGTLGANCTDFIHSTTNNISIDLYSTDPGAAAKEFRCDYIYANITYNIYSLNVSYILDNIGSYSSYTIELQATALNTTTNSWENFTVEYSVDGGAWDALGVGYILNGTSEQTLSETTYAVPSSNVTVRITDNTTGTTPDKNTIRIDFIELHGTIPKANVTLTGENSNDKFGYSVSGAGNVNGDSYDDVIVGAPGYDNGRGKVYVAYGSSSLASEYNVEKNLMTQDFSSGVPPTGWTEELNGGDWTSSATTNAGGTSPEAKFVYGTGTGPSRIYSGAIDTTGYNSIRVTFKHFIDYYAKPNLVGVEIRAGSTDAWATVWSRSCGANVGPETVSVIIKHPYVGSSTFQIGWYVGVNTNNVDYWYVDDIYLYGITEANVTRIGESSNNNFGYSVSAAGDVNNDGYDDFAVGAPGYDGNKGRAYVYYGSPCMQSSDEVTITNQPGDNGDHHVGKDALVISGAATSNYGTSTEFRIGYYSTDAKYRTYLRFDLSTIPSDANVLKAEMKLYMFGTVAGGNQNINVTRVTEVWYETTLGTLSGVTWDTQPASDSVIWAAFSVTPTVEWYTCDITTLVGYWVNGTYTNYGVNLSNIAAENAAVNNYNKFYSSDYATDHSLAPKLEITIRKPADLTISGDDADDKFGYSVSGKDLNNDSFSDIIVGVPYKDNGTDTDAGAVYVFFGNTTMPSITNASHADNETFGNETNMTLGFSVGYADLNNDGYNDLIAGAYNYSSDKGKVYALTCRRATLTVSNWTNQAPASANTGTGDVLMLNMTLTASECTIRVTNIRVNLTGTGADSDVSACRLFHDANDNGAYDSGTDVFLGNQTFSGGSLNFTLSFDVAYGTPEKLLLLFNITDSAAAVGHYVGANLTDYSFISVARPDNVSSYNFPVNSTYVEITSAGDKLTVIGLSLAPEFVNQGSTNRTMLNLTFNSSNAENGQITVISINISLTGTGTGTNVSGVTIYNDTNSNGILDTGDEQLNTTQVFSNGYVVFGDLNFAVYYSNGNYTVFVVYNISSSATIDATVGANVTSKAKITVTSPDSVNTFSTIWSANSTIIEPANINYTIRNGTTGLEEGVGYRKWGNWTIDPGDPPTNSTNWLRIRNTNCLNANQQVVVDFSNTTFNQTAGSGTIPIDGSIWFWYFFTNSSSETPDHWINSENNATTGVNETADGVTDGARTFTFNTVGEYIWIVYRMEGIPEILPNGDYTASFTVSDV